MAAPKQRLPTAWRSMPMEISSVPPRTGEATTKVSCSRLRRSSGRRWLVHPLCSSQKMGIAVTSRAPCDCPWPNRCLSAQPSSEAHLAFRRRTDLPSWLPSCKSRISSPGRHTRRRPCLCPCSASARHSALGIHCSRCRPTTGQQKRRQPVAYDSSRFVPFRTDFETSEIIFQGPVVRRNIHLS